MSVTAPLNTEKVAELNRRRSLCGKIEPRLAYLSLEKLDEIMDIINRPEQSASRQISVEDDGVEPGSYFEGSF